MWEREMVIMMKQALSGNMGEEELVDPYGSLRMGGISSVGRNIGRGFAVQSVDDLMKLMARLNMGDPEVTHQDEAGMKIKVRGRSNSGLPKMQLKMDCDLEGAIMEGALEKIMNKKVSVLETKCISDGESYCVYEVKFI